jgi:hypothetical protein
VYTQDLLWILEKGSAGAGGGGSKGGGSFVAFSRWWDQDQAFVAISLSKLVRCVELLESQARD